MKKYIAKTNVSINIVLAGGANRHISFSALTGGGSVFYTDDADIIEAMERHYKYGTLFRVDRKYEAEKPKVKHVAKLKAEEREGDSQSSQSTPSTLKEDAGSTQSSLMADAEAQPSSAENSDEAETSDSEQNDEEEDGLKVIVVSDPDAAKAYLAEHFGVSRTKIKSVKTIKEIAAKNGIEFQGI